MQGILTISKVSDYAFLMHLDQKYGGKPYDYHLSGVVDILKKQCLGLDYIVVGWLHDVLEDTEATEQDLIYLGCTYEQIDSIKAITKLKHESYGDYLARVSQNEIAKKVKIADSLFNLKECISQGDFKRAKKYSGALDKLLNVSS